MDGFGKIVLGWLPIYLNQLHHHDLLRMRSRHQ